MSLTDADRRAILDLFLEDAPARAARIASQLDRLAAGDEALAAVSLEAHNLHGAAMSVELPDLAQLAVRLSVTVKLAREQAADTRAVLDAGGVLVEALCALPGPEGAGAETSATAAVGAAGTVLHVEDNPSNRKLVERILARREDVRLVEAQTGEDGVRLARELLPNLVLLDLRLPDIPGEEVLRRLKADPATASIRVVVISAEARPAETDRLLVAGATDYLVKPFDVQQIVAIVDQAVPRAP